MEADRREGGTGGIGGTGRKGGMGWTGGPNVTTRKHWSSLIEAAASLLCWTCGSAPSPLTSPSPSVLNEATVIGRSGRPRLNANSVSGVAFRTLGIICRWQLPVPVYFQD